MSNIARVKTREEYKENFIKGINLVVDTVSETLGPKGSNVMICTPEGMQVTKDGVTLMRYLSIEGEEQRIASQFVVGAAQGAVDLSGDGTSTTAVLLGDMVNAGMSSESIRDKWDYQKGMEDAKNLIIKGIKKRATKVTTEKALIDVGVISANNNTDLGQKIAKLVWSVGAQGIVHVESSISGEDIVEKKEGYLFDSGLLTNHFVNNRNDNTCTYENPVFLIINEKISDATQISKILAHYRAWISTQKNKNRPLVFIVGDMEGGAYSTIISSLPRNIRKEGQFSANMAVIKAPDFHLKRDAYLSDIAMLTGTRRIYDKIRGVNIDTFGDSDEELEYGSAIRIVTKNGSTVIEFDPEIRNTQKFKDYISGLKTRLENTNDKIEKEFIEERIAKLNSGIGFYSVGAPTAIELEQKRALVDDSQRSCFAALRGGYVPGGGVTLLRAANEIPKPTGSVDYISGYISVINACEEPIKRILKNFDSSTYLENFDQIKEEKREGFGYNLKISTEIVDLKKAGVIDAAEVPITALSKATSVAGQILTTERMIVIA